MLSKVQANFYADECEKKIREFKANLKLIKNGGDIERYLEQNRDIAEWLMRFSKFNLDLQKKVVKQ